MHDRTKHFYKFVLKSLAQIVWIWFILAVGGFIGFKSKQDDVKTSIIGNCSEIWDGFPDRADKCIHDAMIISGLDDR